MSSINDNTDEPVDVEINLVDVYCVLDDIRDILRSNENRLAMILEELKEARKRSEELTKNYDNQGNRMEGELKGMLNSIVALGQKPTEHKHQEHSGNLKNNEVIDGK